MSNGGFLHHYSYYSFFYPVSHGTDSSYPHWLGDKPAHFENLLKLSPPPTKAAHPSVHVRFEDQSPTTSPVLPCFFSYCFTPIHFFGFNRTSNKSNP
jgi:hypothetical protein